jgi:ribosome maturation factor RimP
MRYTAKDTDKETSSLRPPLEEILKGLGFSLVELTVSRHRGSVQVKVVIYNGASVSTDDCSKVHRAVTPRLELAFPGNDLYLEVSSPGIDRLIKGSDEFFYYIGKGIRCYRIDISDWTAGILQAVDEEGIVLQTKEEAIRLDFKIIAKAKLAV